MENRTLAFYATKMGKGYLLIAVEHDSGTKILRAGASYCSPKDKFDARGETPEGMKARNIALGRMRCERTNKGNKNWVARIMIGSVENTASIYALLPFIAEQVCLLTCAPDWARKAAKKRSVVMVGTHKEG